jgi:hypothetical protein
MQARLVDAPEGTQMGPERYTSQTSPACGGAINHRDVSFAAPVGFPIPMPTEDAYDDHLVLWLLIGLILLYTGRLLYKAKVTMEEIRFRLNRASRFLDSKLSA